MKMYLLLLLSLIVCHTSSFAGIKDITELELKGNLKKPPLKSPGSGGSGSFGGPVDSFVKATIDDRTLQINFFYAANDLTITISHVIDGVVYEETINVNATTQKTIDLTSYQDGHYEIWMRNNEYINIYGDFWLGDE